MPKADVLAETLCDLARELTSHRRGGGPHWIAVSDIEDAMRRHGLDIDHDDLQAAIAICVERHTMKAEGRPFHSIAPWQKEWKI
jgi:hypothetical protein